MEGANCPKVKLAPSFLKKQSPLPWKGERLQPCTLEESNSPVGAEGKAAASCPPSASFKKLLLDGWDRPTHGAGEKQEGKSHPLARKEDPEGDFCLQSQEDSSVSSPNPNCLLSFQTPLVKSLHFEKQLPHQERCAAITSDICEMLLGGEPAYRGCLSSVAAFILEREVASSQSPHKETYELVSLGTGDVCHEGWMEFGGRKLHDLHGLVVARRALMRYLYKQLLMCCSQDPTAVEKCIFCWAEDGEHLRLKPNYYLHLYLSQTPSGAMENFQTTVLHSNPSVDLHVSVKGVLKPVSYCCPSALSTHVYCVSGSDKLTRWTVLGVQGALLSHFLHPVYITSIVLADPYQNHSVLHRIINKRLQLGPEDGLPEPYCRQTIYLFEGPRVASLDTPPECRSMSLNWCGGDEMLELVKGAAGKAERDIVNPGGQFRPSRLCKAAMLKSFRKVAQEMKREDLMSLPMYHDAKVQATAYQSAKLQLYGQLSVQELSKWPQKQLVDGFCR